MAGLGFFFASILAIVNNKLKVEEDPKIMLLEGVLPGSNCGVCGFTSCHQYAEALAKGAAEPDKCKAGGENARAGISRILGVQLEKKIKSIALVHCGQEESIRKKKAVYFGINTCSAAHKMIDKPRYSGCHGHDKSRCQPHSHRLLYFIGNPYKRADPQKIRKNKIMRYGCGDEYQN